MTLTIFEKFWHRTLGRPFRLARTIDLGQGENVVLLHGLGRSAEVWRHVVEGLAPLGFRVTAFDLLGFGASPKPQWLDYNVDDHAAAVIAGIENLRPAGPVVLVGHSMGCLVAVRVAKLRPELVRQLVLYEMPMHDGLPEKRRYKILNDLFFRFYKQIMAIEPNFNEKNMRLAERLGRRVVGMEVTEETWLPLVKSLENTIMNQSIAQDIKEITVPMDVIYGTFDMLVIRGNPQEFFGEDAGNIKSYKVRARHEITPKASQFIVDRVKAGTVIG